MSTPNIPDIPNIEIVRTSEVNNTVNFAALFGIFTLFITLLFYGAGVVVNVPHTFLQWGTVGIVLIGGFATGAIILSGFHRGTVHINNIVNEFLDWSTMLRNAESYKRLPAPAPELPPAAPEVPVVTSHVSNPVLVGGFDKGDLRALCFAFCSGSKWTEDALIGRELPVTGEGLSKDRYTALMQLFVDRGAILDRGGPGNRTGRLASKDPGELLRLLMLSGTPLPEWMTQAPPP